MVLIELSDSLGLIIHPDKSSSMLKQNITFLGFSSNSRDMKISVTNQRKSILVLFSDPTKQSKANHKVYSLDYWIYNIQSTKSLSEEFHYKHLEKDKVIYLKDLKAHLMQKCFILKKLWETLSDGMKILQVQKMAKIPWRMIYSDASNSDWGQYLKIIKERPNSVLRKINTT